MADDVDAPPMDGTTTNHKTHNHHQTHHQHHNQEHHNTSTTRAPTPPMPPIPPTPRLPPPHLHHYAVLFKGTPMAAAEDEKDAEETAAAEKIVHDIHQHGHILDEEAEDLVGHATQHAHHTPLTTHYTPRTTRHTPHTTHHTPRTTHHAPHATHHTPHTTHHALHATHHTNHAPECCRSKHSLTSTRYIPHRSTWWTTAMPLMKMRWVGRERGKVQGTGRRTQNAHTGTHTHARS